MHRNSDDESPPATDLPSGVPRAIVVEDHPRVRRAIIATLQKGGIDVTGEAADGEQAIEVVCREQPEVVVMDIELPVLSGTAVTRELRHLTPNVSILALTLHNDPATIAEVRAAGARGFVSKSDSPTDLVQAVFRVAAGESVWPSESLVPSSTPGQADGDSRRSHES